MQKSIYITILILSFISCSKDLIDLKLSDPDEKFIVAEGHFSDSLEKQKFTFTWTQTLGESVPNYIDDIELTITTPEGSEGFTRISPGTYESNNAFKGHHGEVYGIEFNHDGVSHKTETKMPQPIEITEYFFQEIDSVNTYYNQLFFSFYANSPVKQYLRYTIERAYRPYEDEDTIWTNYLVPIFQIAEIPAGDHVVVSIKPIANFGLSEDILVRIKTEIVNEEVGNYLINLQNYSNSATEEGKSLNPPYFYSNKAYGLGYGTIKGEIIHLY